MTNEVVLDRIGGKARVENKVAEAHTKFINTKMFGSLNGLRALCCLVVIKFHCDWFSGLRIVDQGSLGVEVFFTISGFLIVTLIIRERERTGTVDLRKFYIRRSLRIFPVYYAIILTVLAASLVLVAVHKPNLFHYYRWGFLVLLTYTQDILRTPVGTFRPCWTLAMEEQFYLLWPTIEKYFSATGRWIALAFVIVVSELVNFRFFDPLIGRIYHDPSASMEPLFLVTFAPIAFGVCFAHWLHHRRSFEYLYRIVGQRWSPILWLIVLAAVLQFSPEDLAGWPRLLIHLSIVLFLGSLVIREDNMLAGFLKTRFLVEIGTISYGLYLFHQWIRDYTFAPINHLAARIGLTSNVPILRFLIVATLAILVAKVSFKYFEEPIIRKRVRFQS